MRQDLRIQKTIKNIHAVFRAMIVESDFGSITVAELCRRAQINKKTFYHYYESLDTLLGALQAEYSSAYLRRIRGLEIPRDIGRLIRAFFEFSAEQDKAYEKITLAGTVSDRAIRQEMIDSVMGVTLDKSAWAASLPSFYRTAFLTFWNSTVLDLYKEWVAGGKEVELDEVIAVASDFVEGGLRALEARTGR